MRMRKRTRIGIAAAVVLLATAVGLVLAPTSSAQPRGMPRSSSATAALCAGRLLIPRSVADGSLDVYELRGGYECVTAMTPAVSGYDELTVTGCDPRSPSRCVATGAVGVSFGKEGLKALILHNRCFTVTLIVPTGGGHLTGVATGRLVDGFPTPTCIGS